MRRIPARKPARHVDVGSHNEWAVWMSVQTPITFIDIRPLPVKTEGFDSKAGSVLNLPYPDASVDSISCLHVIEHVGLGRYGDPLDPQGTIKACKELARVLAPGGRLYLSTPVGRARVCFNAHRITPALAGDRIYEGAEPCGVLGSQRLE